MGYYENKLKSIAANDGFDMPDVALLSPELHEIAGLLGRVQITLGWTGSSAESAQQKLESLRVMFRDIAIKTDRVQDNCRSANVAVGRAAQALGDLPGVEVPKYLVDAVKAGASVVLKGVPLPADVAIDSAVSALASGREEAAKKAVKKLERELHENNVELAHIIGARVSGPWSEHGPGPRPDDDDDYEGQGEGGFSSGSSVEGWDGGGYRPSFGSPLADVTAPTASSVSPSGSSSPSSHPGSGDHRLGPDGALSPHDPRGAGGSGSGSGVGSGRVDLGAKPVTTAFGGGAGIGAGILGAGGIGAGARLASGGLKGLSGGTVGGGAGRIGSVSGGGGGVRLGATGAGGLSGAGGGGGVRLGASGGAGGGLSGAAASSPGAAGGSSATLGTAGSGAAGTTGAGAAGSGGGTGIMGGGGQGLSQERGRGRARGLGGIIAPKLEDDDELPPRSAAAGPGSRDGS